MSRAKIEYATEELKLGIKYKAFNSIYVVKEIYCEDFGRNKRKYFMQELNGKGWFYADNEMLLNGTIIELFQ